MTYLGALVAADGLGLAEAEFRKLSQVWRDSGLTPNERCKVYSACVVSKLLYGLDTANLTNSHLKRLDAFQLKGLRQIMKIETTWAQKKRGVEMSNKKEQI